MSRAPLPLRDDERLIFALDVPDRVQALEWVDRLGDSVAFYKIGMELLASGEYFQVLDELARRDKRVFVDLKFFDIPATAAAVIKRLSQWPVSYATIHGWHPAMMEACAAANSSDMRLLAVTVLTSMGRPDLAQMGIDREPVEVVVERALAAQAAGIDNIHSFGQHAKAEFRLAEFDGAAELSTVWVSFGGETREVTIGAPGRHLAENAMAVLAAVSLVGADVDAAIEALANLTAVKGRGARHKLKMPEGVLTLIDESYNANPASMRAAISVLASAQPTGEGRRIAVLGDMLEMGEFAPSVHADLAGPLLAAGIEHVWLAGPEMVALRDALPETVHVVYLETTEELANFVTAEVRPGDVVMVKSSLGIGFGKIVSALLDKHPAFSDTERQF